MSQKQREERIQGAFNHLVKSFVPKLEDEDADYYAERRANAHELATSILHSGTAPAVVADRERHKY